jgi:hypothetical protein
MGKRDGGGPGPYEERLLRTRNKLRSALERLIAGRPLDPTLRKIRYRLTVSALAREASVGRNAIYTNHRPIIEDLRHATVRDSQSPRGSAKNKLDEQRALIYVMKVAERRMITENAVLLKRAMDAEAEAARHRKHNARLIVERDTALRPVRIASKRG